MQRKLFWITWIVIVFLAIALRFYQLGKVPFSLYWDEAAMMVDVKSVVQTGHDMFGRPWFQLIYPSYGDFKLAVYIWSATLSAKIFGVSEWSLRLPSALAGVGTVIIGGLLARQIFAKNKQSLHESELVQLITMFILAITPWDMMFSRTGFEGHLAQFFLGLSVCFTLASKKKWWFIIFAAFLGALATYTYFSVRFVWPVVFLLACFLSSDKTRNFKRSFIQAVMGTILFLLMLIPLYRSPLYADTNTFRLGTDSVLNRSEYPVQTNVYRQLGGNSRVDRVLFSPRVFMMKQLLENYAANSSLQFLFTSGDPNLRHGTGKNGLFFLIFLPFFISGIYYLFFQRRGVLFFLLGWWIIALLPASVPLNVPHALRSLNALVPIALIIGVGLTQIFLFLESKLSRSVAFLAISLILISICISDVSFIYHYFTFYPKESASDWQNGYKQLAQVITTSKHPNEDVWILPFDDRFYLWFMAYGPYTGKDFQSWKSEKYQFPSFDHISFHEPDQNHLNMANYHYLLAGQVDAVHQQLVKSKSQPTRLEIIKGDDGKDRFAVASF